MRLFNRKRLSNFMKRRIGRKLRLDPQQQEQLSALQGEMHKAHSDMHDIKRSTRGEVYKLFAAETLDKEEARRLLELPAQNMEAMLGGVVDSFADLFDGLSVDQRDQMMKLWHHKGRCWEAVAV